MDLVVWLLLLLALTAHGGAVLLFGVRVFVVSAESYLWSFLFIVGMDILSTRFFCPEDCEVEKKPRKENMMMPNVGWECAYWAQKNTHAYLCMYNEHTCGRCLHIIRITLLHICVERARETEKHIYNIREIYIWMEPPMSSAISYQHFTASHVPKAGVGMCLPVSVCSISGRRQACYTHTWKPSGWSLSFGRRQPETNAHAVRRKELKCSISSCFFSSAQWHGRRANKDSS